jgi:hypothetical protein
VSRQCHITFNTFTLTHKKNPNHNSDLTQQQFTKTLFHLGGEGDFYLFIYLFFYTIVKGLTTGVNAGLTQDHATVNLALKWVKMNLTQVMR